MIYLLLIINSLLYPFLSVFYHPLTCINVRLTAAVTASDIHAPPPMMPWSELTADSDAAATQNTYALAV